MLKYSRIGVNLLTTLVVTSILLTTFFIERMINTNNVSNIIIPKIDLFLEILDEQDTKEKHAKKYEMQNNFNNIVLEIYNVNLENLERNEIIMYVKNNKASLYKICAIKILADISLMNLKEFEENNLIMIQKNTDRSITYIQATRLGVINEIANSK